MPTADSRRATPPASGSAADMAIIGMSCRFPGSVGPDAYYRSLLDSIDLFSAPPRERWAWCRDDRVAVSKVGALEEVLAFDCGLFSLSPREAEAMDPHQRMLLEDVWLAVENAGYLIEGFRLRKTGVFVAMYNQDFALFARSGEWDEISRMYLATGSAHSVVPNRISYAFDFRGPSEVVNTACSSALVAVHRAVEAIRGGECEQAIVGGVSLLLEPSRLVMLQELGLLSASGVCAPFDARSKGQVLGEGVAALVIKPLASALRDRDNVQAIISASGVNHQGASSGGLTRPSPVAQAELIHDTYERHGLSPAETSYVEAHGNGGVGDLSELLAFQANFRPGLRVGSVKGNIGFLEAAGGLSQVIKVVMAMQHGLMPATRSHSRLVTDPALRAESCEILTHNTRLEELSVRPDRPFVAGVHAYGLGGSNAHLVLTQFRDRHRAADRRGSVPILLSGDDRAAISDLAERLLDALSRDNSPSVADIAFTLATARRHKARRVAFFVSSTDELMARLRSVRAGTSVDDGPCRAESPAADGQVEEALDGWLRGETVDWEPLLPDGIRTALPSTPLRRRLFSLPALTRTEISP